MSTAIRLGGRRRKPGATGAKRALRIESLEPRTLLSAGGLSSFPTAALIADAAPSDTIVKTTTLAVVADAAVRGGKYQYANFGQSADLMVKNGIVADNDFDAYLKFDLSEIDGPISSAILTLTPVAKGSRAASAQVRLRLVADARDGWLEGDESGEINKDTTGPLTWHDRPTGTGAAVRVKGSSLQTLTPAAIDVTSLIRQKFNKDSIASFQLDMPSAANSERWVDFASDEYASADRAALLADAGMSSSTSSVSLAPTLTVTYAGNDDPIPTNYLGMKDADLAKLTQSLATDDGVVSRKDMIQIFQSLVTKGWVYADQLSDLKTILNNAATLNMPGYVQTLASDVVNGNKANERFQGHEMGNLEAGSAGAQLKKLVDKWLLGADHPNAGKNTYRATAGTLFGSDGPVYADMRQGGADPWGDCYFIAAMGSVAKASPTAIRNMLLDNGDGTWTVRYYVNGKADYVTVDGMLPTSGGKLVYANRGANCLSADNKLWLPLVEKAYAQWNETGNAGADRDGTNTYLNLGDGGWSAPVDAQVLGYNALDLPLNALNQQTLIASAVNLACAVTIGTTSKPPGNGLYANHVYVMIGYDSESGIFQLCDPYNEEGRVKSLTWNQLKTSCDVFASADTSQGTVPIS